MFTSALRQLSCQHVITEIRQYCVYPTCRVWDEIVSCFVCSRKFSHPQNLTKKEFCLLKTSYNEIFAKIYYLYSMYP